MPAVLLRIWADPSRRNSLMAGLQAALGAIAVFGAYRLLVAEVGLEVFGLWSVLLSGASVARMADVSGGGGLARFVADRTARGLPAEAVAFVHSTLLATLGLTVTGSLAVLLMASPLVRHLAPEGMASEIMALLPLALLVSVVLPSLSAALASGIDGMQRADARAVILAGSYAVLFAAVAASVGSLGIHGFALALALQHLFIMAAGWIVLHGLLPGLGWLPTRWSGAAFRESFAFGLKLQAMSLAGLLTDPMVRALVTWHGGVAAAGLYELALRLLLQLRAPLVASIQPIVPMVAALGSDADRVTSLVRAASRQVIVLSIGFVALAASAAPIYSYFMLGSVNISLVLLIGMLAAGYGINLLSVPLFFGALGLGVMRWNLASQLVAAACIASFGNLSGWLHGSTGVVAAQVVGLSLGSATIIAGNAHALGIGGSIRREASRLALGTLAILGVAVLGVEAAAWVNR